MSGASDKARFYLEQAVPELRELERKEIFTKNELHTIVKKRSDFEHTLNARASHVSDYVRYAEFEMNLESLRRKRVKRLGVKATNYTGQRRIFFVLDRATQKFHGDVGLWMLYLSYARKQKSHKKTAEILTRMLRLHPTKGNLWIYAADYAIEKLGDMMEARSYMQRGLRFCERDAHVWLEYGKLEMMAIAKLVRRWQTLGLDKREFSKEAPKAADINADLVALPSVTAEDLNPERKLENVNEAALEKMDDNPIMAGAMPIAVFDAAVQRLCNDQKFFLDFFDMVARFDYLPCQHRILNHVIETLRSKSANLPATMTRYIRLPVIGLEADSSHFPSALGLALSRIKEAEAAIFDMNARVDFQAQIIRWLLPFLDNTTIDDDLRQVFTLTLAKAWDEYRSAVDADPEGKDALTYPLLEDLETRDLRQITEPGRSWAQRLWPKMPQTDVSKTKMDSVV